MKRKKLGDFGFGYRGNDPGALMKVHVVNLRTPGSKRPNASIAVVHEGAQGAVRIATTVADFRERVLRSSFVFVDHVNLQ